MPLVTKKPNSEPTDIKPAATVTVRMIGRHQTVIYDSRTYHSYEDGTGDVFTVDAKNAECLIDEGMVERVGRSATS